MELVNSIYTSICIIIIIAIGIAFLALANCMIKTYNDRKLGKNK